MAEYIKREDTINVINQRIKNDLITGWLNRIIYTVPDADVVEVRHGQWVKSETEGEMLSRCSECGYPVSHWYTTNFCPNCGGRMDKGE